MLVERGRAIEPLPVRRPDPRPVGGLQPVAGRAVVDVPSAGEDPHPPAADHDQGVEVGVVPADLEVLDGDDLDPRLRGWTVATLEERHPGEEDHDARDQRANDPLQPERRAEHDLPGTLRRPLREVAGWAELGLGGGHRITPVVV
jgi:hypothetical protein